MYSAARRRNEMYGKVNNAALSTDETDTLYFFACKFVCFLRLNKQLLKKLNIQTNQILFPRPTAAWNTKLARMKAGKVPTQQLSMNIKISLVTFVTYYFYISLVVIAVLAPLSFTAVRPPMTRSSAYE